MTLLADNCDEKQKTIGGELIGTIVMIVTLLATFFALLMFDV